MKGFYFRKNKKIEIKSEEKRTNAAQDSSRICPELYDDSFRGEGWRRQEWWSQDIARDGPSG